VDIAQVHPVNARILSNLCEYRHKSYIAKNQIRWLTFLLQTSYIYLQPIWHDPQNYSIRRNNSNKRPLRRSRSFKVTGFRTNGKHISNFLVVINTNLRISHRFRVIVDYWSNLRFLTGYLSLTHLFGVNP